jgi:sugar/nucleoside kinase (ribokinase family)
MDGFEVEVRDTVAAGDAFNAGIAITSREEVEGLLRNGAGFQF